MNCQTDPEKQPLLPTQSDAHTPSPARTRSFMDWTSRFSLAATLIWIVCIIQSTDRHAISVTSNEMEMKAEAENQALSCPDPTYPWYGESNLPVSSQYTKLKVEFDEMHHISLKLPKIQQRNSIRVQPNSTVQEVFVTFDIKTGEEYRDRIYMMPEYVNNDTLTFHIGRDNFDDDFVCFSVNIIVDVPSNTTLESFEYSTLRSNVSISNNISSPAGLSLSVVSGSIEFNNVTFGETLLAVSSGSIKGQINL
ncbi:hypothetical protein J3Q64DRAFT_1836253 [Phycomyces blakesleeanus]|uniref:Adhesin domain-containing protein n=2 Tax=Phycomyces blakesleeanus TaxID=4837 RepID=A0A162XCE1_PHYB8|nr:hypothetical protein PHYBLDRAFT_64869 [Phycomyces blakesleeanus NRRL 1555(-)]OAD73915.1 hypothetical protein PHYBLDRAFT_64869 [Phycomyces blakesleeanus NRRL 1555(-)]|eukprot:XP_018291955.1 hypothetical protein PHYBLDRAFT_64869 [Phycomyces blakesleeanus NRRL 1555(-)]